MRLAPVRAGEGACDLFGLLDFGVVGPDVAAEAGDGSRLGNGGVGRHDDGRLGADDGGGKRDGGTVVARRERHDAGTTFLLGELQDPVQRTTELERPRSLQVLRLDENVSTADFVERRRGEDARAVHDPPGPIGGRPDPSDRQRRRCQEATGVA